MTTVSMEQVQLRSKDHLWCDWFDLQVVLPQLGRTRCQHCEHQEATRWNADDELGTLLYCAGCVDAVYEPFTYDEIEPAHPDVYLMVLDFIQTEGTVTFPQLARFLISCGVPVTGEWAISHPTRPNHTIWESMSGVMMDLITTLESDGDVMYRETSVQSYLEDGTVPIFTQLSSHSKKHGRQSSHHWMPTLIVPGPAQLDPAISED